MTDKSWKLLTKLIDACGYDINQIEDEFDFDELCEYVRTRLTITDKQIIIDDQRKTTHRLQDDYNKLYKTLTEIKEIAEPFCNACQEFEPEKIGNNCMYCNYGKILQKIREVIK